MVRICELFGDTWDCIGCVFEELCAAAFFGVAGACWLEVCFVRSFLRVGCIVLGEGSLEEYWRDNRTSTLAWHLVNSLIYGCKSKYSAIAPFPDFHWVACIALVALKLLF